MSLYSTHIRGNLCAVRRHIFYLKTHLNGFHFSAILLKYDVELDAVCRCAENILVQYVKRNSNNQRINKETSWRSKTIETFQCVQLKRSEKLMLPWEIATSNQRDGFGLLLFFSSHYFLFFSLKDWNKSTNVFLSRVQIRLA